MPGSNGEILDTATHEITPDNTLKTISEKWYNEELEATNNKLLRERSFEKMIADAIGKKAPSYPLSAPVIINILKDMMFGGKAECFAYYVDPEKVEKTKAACIANPEEKGESITASGHIAKFRIT